jgi:NAD(P)H-nitrite reductase large subunit
MKDKQALAPYQNRHAATLDRADILVVGNGIAGLTAAVEARRLAPDKRIAIITDQLHPTINTPALKQFAVGKVAREQLLAYPVGTERTERIHVINAHVNFINTQNKYVQLNDNRGFGYESLLIATGSTPMGLSENIPGRNFDGVLTLHRLKDYLDLRRRLSEVEEAVVIGGGVHAIETVMGLVYWGIRVHWLIRGRTFMGKVIDAPASDMVLNTVRRSGVLVHMETEVVGIVGRVGAVAGVITNQQEMLPCQLVLCCTGTQPALDLPHHSNVPMKFQGGVMVDDKMRTSVRDIYAAGDVAALRNPQTGKYEPRALWYAAIAQGRVAGSMLAGYRDPNRQPFGVQWHATHLGELCMLTVGEPLRDDSDVQVLTDNSQGGYRRLTVMGDRLIGYLALGPTQPDGLAIKRIIDESYSVRDMIKPLLKGQFDARRYFSRPRAKTRQLPPAQTVPEVNAPKPASAAAFAEQKRTALLPAEPQYGTFEDEINPFSGNLPAYVPTTRASTNSREHAPARYATPENTVYWRSAEGQEYNYETVGARRP